MNQKHQLQNICTGSIIFLTSKFKSIKLLYFLMILSSFLLQACVSEEQEKINTRVADLDQSLEMHKPAIEKFIEGVKELSKQVSPKQPALNQNNFSGDDTLISEMIEEYREISSIDDMSALNPPVNDKNTIIIHLAPDIKIENPNEMIQYLPFAEKQELGFVFDRMIGEDWHYTISDPDDYTSDERRDEDALKVKNVIEKTAGVRYLAGIEEKLLIWPVIIDEKNFEAGMLVAGVHVFDIKTKRVVADFFVRVKNSFMVFSFTNESDSQEEELIDDLRNEAYKTVKEILKNPDNNTSSRAR